MRLEKPATVEQINAAFRAAAENPAFRACSRSAVNPRCRATTTAIHTFGDGGPRIDADGRRHGQGVGGYDNEMGYSNRLYELAKLVSEKSQSA